MLRYHRPFMTGILALLVLAAGFAGGLADGLRPSDARGAGLSRVSLPRLPVVLTADEAQSERLDGVLHVALSLCLCTVAVAEDTVNEDEKAGAKVSAETQAVKDLHLAGQLSEWGREHKNPTALLVAAQILKSTPSQEQEADKKTESSGLDKKGAAAEDDTQGSVATAESLLEEAKAMAEGQAQMVAMIEAEEAVKASRGSIMGPGCVIDRISGNPDRDEDVWTGEHLVFKGDELAAVGNEGDGDTDLNLFVFDENQNKIRQSTGNSDREIVGWVPSWTGPFIVVIKNHGRRSNMYKLCWN